MKWSIEEEKFLKENYTVMPDEEIARYLGRTLSSVRGKVNFEKSKNKQNRLTKKNNYLTEEQRKEKVKRILLLATGVLLD